MSDEELAKFSYLIYGGPGPQNREAMENYALQGLCLQDGLGNRYSEEDARAAVMIHDAYIAAGITSEDLPNIAAIIAHSPFALFAAHRVCETYSLKPRAEDISYITSIIKNA
jgi:hypothetical protein